MSLATIAVAKVKTRLASFPRSAQERVYPTALASSAATMAVAGLAAHVLEGNGVRMVSAKAASQTVAVKNAGMMAVEAHAGLVERGRLAKGVSACSSCQMFLLLTQGLVIQVACPCVQAANVDQMVVVASAARAPLALSATRAGV